MSRYQHAVDDQLSACEYIESMLKRGATPRRTVYAGDTVASPLERIVFCLDAIRTASDWWKEDA